MLGKRVKYNDEIYVVNCNIVDADQKGSLYKKYVETLYPYMLCNITTGKPLDGIGWDDFFIKQDCEILGDFIPNFHISYNDLIPELGILSQNIEGSYLEVENDILTFHIDEVGCECQESVKKWMFVIYKESATRLYTVGSNVKSLKEVKHAEMLRELYSFCDNSTEVDC